MNASNDFPSYITSVSFCPLQVQRRDREKLVKYCQEGAYKFGKSEESGDFNTDACQPWAHQVHVTASQCNWSQSF